MSATAEKRFEFILPYNDITKDELGRPKSIHLFDLTIQGVGYFFDCECEEYMTDFDIDGIFFEGKNILPVLKVIDCEFKDGEIGSSTKSHVRGLFASEIMEALGEHEDDTTDRNQGEVDIFGRLTEYFHFQHGC